MARRYVEVMLAAWATTGLWACSDTSGQSYRFRATVEVETPQGIRIGSSVYEVGAGRKLKLTAEEGSRYLWSRGEAVTVDLPNGRTLFVLLKTGALHGDVATISMATLDPAFNNDMPESVARIVDRQGVRSRAIVSASDYPVLVTFRDVSDPESVERTDPAALDKHFGSGVRLKRITVELTDAAVTTGIEKKLVWLAQSKDGGLDPTIGVTAKPTFAQQLSFLDFRRK